MEFAEIWLFLLQQDGLISKNSHIDKQEFLCAFHLT